MRRRSAGWGMMAMVAAGLIGLGVPAQANERHQQADRFVGRLEKKLHLTPDQTTQIQAIAEQTAKQHRALYDQFNTQLQQLQRSKLDRIQVLLTAEQRTEFSKIREKQEERMEKKARKHHRH